MPKVKGRLTKTELNQLANYNSEVARGLVHTGIWVDKMRDLQNRYDRYGYSYAG